MPFIDITIAASSDINTFHQYLIFFFQLALCVTIANKFPMNMTAPG